MFRILKFPLGPNQEFVLMPLGAKVLDIQVQHGEVKIWALCDDKVTETEMRRFITYPTGMKIPNPTERRWLKYITTYQQPPFVWHVFEEKEHRLTEDLIEI